jgi:hypothetical protein
VVQLLRALVLVSGALAAAGCVLAIFTLQRHRGARVGLGVVSLLLLFTATFVAGFLPVVVAVAATMLWGREARDWFAGVTPRPAAPAPARPNRSADPGSPGMAAWNPPVASARSGQDVPAAAVRPFAGAQPAPGAVPVGTHPHPGGTSRRPRAVTVAAWLTWVFSGLVAAAFALVVVTLLAQRDRLLADLRTNDALGQLGLTDQEVVSLLWVLSAVCIFWALSAAALAVLAFRRVNLGRIGLVVSAVVAAIVGLLAIPVGWPHAFACIATVALLFSGAANRWYAGDGHPQGGSRPQVSPPPPLRDGKPPVW